MVKIEQLIDDLAKNALPVRPMLTPRQLMLRLSGVLGLYSLAVAFVIGLRPDLAQQLQRPFFLVEILLLLALVRTSANAAVLLAFPDHYQQSSALRLPYYILGTFLFIILIQYFLPFDPRMVLPIGAGVHKMECTLCIASVAIIPSAFMFLFLKKGASVHPILSGGYSVLASAGLGCLMLRLAEANDSLSHLMVWHYIPTFLFAALGAWIGKIFLKW